MAQLISERKIREWHDQLARGKGVDMTPPWTYELAVKMAVVRWMNGLGPDETSAEGPRAMANVRAVLD